jgi:hypothetical protein
MIHKHIMNLVRLLLFLTLPLKNLLVHIFLNYEYSWTTTWISKWIMNIFSISDLKRFQCWHVTTFKYVCFNFMIENISTSLCKRITYILKIELVYQSIISNLISCLDKCLEHSFQIKVGFQDLLAWLPSTYVW